MKKKRKIDRKVFIRHAPKASVDCSHFNFYHHSLNSNTHRKTLKEKVLDRMHWSELASHHHRRLVITRATTQKKKNTRGKI